MAAPWGAGDLIVRREVLGLAPYGHAAPQADWHGCPWEGVPVYVVEDSSDQLVTHLPEGAEIGFAEGEWPTPDGKHPWQPKSHWEGHGCLMVQRPGDPCAVWHSSSGLVTWIREIGAHLGEQLDAGRQWWDPAWARWVPPAGWRDAVLPADWSATPCPAT